MSRPRPPPPCPPSRPDLEGDTITDVTIPQPIKGSVLHSKSSKAVPPPIPLRPDLGEGIEDDIAHFPTVLKSPASPDFPMAPKCTILAPSVPAHSVPAPCVSVPSVPAPFIPAPSVPVPSVPAPSVPAPSVPAPSVPVPSVPVPSVPAPSVPVPSVPVPSVPAPSVPVPSVPVPSVPAPSVPAPSVPAPKKTGHSKFRGRPEITIVSAQPMSTTGVFSSPTPNSTALLKTKTSPTLPSPSSSGSPSPQKLTKSSKPREPPQRPKSKPVCELPASVDMSPGSLGTGNTSAFEKQDPSPVAPKRKKNKDSEAKHFGINNSAFLENEPERSEIVPIKNSQHLMDLGEDVTAKKQSGAVSTKPKSFPTVIRTKPNGKENVKQDFKSAQGQQVEHSEDLPTVIRPQVKSKPAPLKKKPKPSSYTSLQQEDNTENQFQPVEVSPPQTALPQAKPKMRPTVIIPKTKKDFVNKNECSDNKPDERKTPSSASEADSLAQPVFENKSTGFDVQKASKPKRIPSIIRPSKLKKDKVIDKKTNLLEDNTLTKQGYRGSPEGENQDITRIQPRRGSMRKAPPRPSPPKPGPLRPGPPNRSTANESKASIETLNQSVKFQAHPRPPPAGTKVEQTAEFHAPQSSQKHPRPPTIGKDREVEENKSIEIRKQKKHVKKSDSTMVSSVVSTQIEPSAIALYDYDATCADDLSFKAGDEIFLVKRIDKDWYIGRLGDCQGMMPVKFVEVIEDLPPEPKEQPEKGMLSLNTLVLYDFHAQSRDELTVHAGDTVELLGMVSDDWIKGKSNGITGIFPANFIDITQDLKLKLTQKGKQSPNSSNLTKRDISVVTSGPRCKALFDYDTNNSDDLKFEKDDIIELKDRISAEWMRGRFNGTTGMFPAAYVEIIEDFNMTSTTRHDESSFPVTKALHDYMSSAAGDLSFKKGDMITILQQISEDWLQGELHGEKGLLPSAYVENVVLPGSSHHNPVSKKNPNLECQDSLLPRGKALYDFTGETDNELTFKAGDEMFLLQSINEEWMEGELNNNIGQFPVAFIEILIPLP